MSNAGSLVANMTGNVVFLGFAAAGASGLSVAEKVGDASQDLHRPLAFSREVEDDPLREERAT